MWNTLLNIFLWLSMLVSILIIQGVVLGRFTQVAGVLQFWKVFRYVCAVFGMLMFIVGLVAVLLRNKDFSSLIWDATNVIIVLVVTLASIYTLGSIQFSALLHASMVATAKTDSSRIAPIDSKMMNSYIHSWRWVHLIIDFFSKSSIDSLAQIICEFEDSKEDVTH